MIKFIKATLILTFALANISISQANASQFEAVKRTFEIETGSINPAEHAYICKKVFNTLIQHLKEQRRHQQQKVLSENSKYFDLFIDGVKDEMKKEVSEKEAEESLKKLKDKIDAKFTQDTVKIVAAEKKVYPTYCSYFILQHRSHLDERVKD